MYVHTHVHTYVRPGCLIAFLAMILIGLLAYHLYAFVKQLATKDLVHITLYVLPVRRIGVEIRTGLVFSLGYVLH